MRYLFYLFCLIFILGCPDADSVKIEENGSKTSSGKDLDLVEDYPIEPVDFTHVNINDTFWAPRLKTNRNITLPYTINRCEDTGRISNFSKAGRLEDGEFEGIFFNDSDVFKVIEGASYSLQTNDDPQLKQYLDELISKIGAAQEPDGYLYTNRTINPSKANDGAGNKRWTRLVSHHELYNVGHLYEAAVAHYKATGERSLLDIAIKNADLVDSVFGYDKNMGVPGHSEIEIGLVKLYRVTGEKKYLRLAKFFIDQRGNEEGHNINDGPYSGEYQQDHLPLSQQKQAVGHAVRAGYLYAGATDIATLTGETAYDQSLELIWEDIVHKKIYLTGGIGAEPKYEGFGPAYELPNATAYTETCAAISLMLWNHRMFLRSGEAKYMDVFERTLFNGFLSGVSLEGDTFFYPNPLESDGIFTFNHGVCGRSPWFDTSCCPVNIVRTLPSVPGYIYAVKNNNVFVNLYMNNKAEIAVGKKTLHVVQQTDYPWQGKIVFGFTNENSVDATLHLRIPAWSKNNIMDGALYTYEDQEKSYYTIQINGKPIKPDEKNGYAVLPLQGWSKKDKIQMNFHMPVRKVVCNPLVAANRDKMAIERGPLVYCFEEVDNNTLLFEQGISANTEFHYRFEKELLGGIGTIQSSKDTHSLKMPIKAIPYYAWANRKNGKMSVWLDRNP